jgi:hypothetical protein
MNDPRHPQAVRPAGQPVHPQQVVHPHGQRPGIAPQPVLKRPSPENDGLDPIALVEDDELEVLEENAATPAHAPKKIIAFGEEAHHKKHEWKRKTTCNGTGACRVKTFHGKYSDQGMNYLDDAINEWLDNHPDVEIKFVTSTVATFEGKIREPALVLNVWY